MKGLRKKKETNRKLSKDESRWNELASFYESDESLSVLAKGKTLSASELRAIASKGKTKPVSIRIPEIDLIALKRLAKISKGKYQKLIVQAIERFLDEEERKHIAV